MAEHNLLGMKGEAEAELFLRNKGYHILEKNWRYRKAEVDLIAKHKNFIVIVEVKTRRSDYFGQPEESVTDAKQKLMCEAAEAYLEEKNLDCEIRFDVISIIHAGEKNTIRHIEDAFKPQAG